MFLILFIRVLVFHTSFLYIKLCWAFAPFDSCLILRAVASIGIISGANILNCVLEIAKIDHIPLHAKN
jgi:hypothetical protein